MLSERDTKQLEKTRCEAKRPLISKDTWAKKWFAAHQLSRALIEDRHPHPQRSKHGDDDRVKQLVMGW